MLFHIFPFSFPYSEPVSLGTSVFRSSRTDLLVLKGRVGGVEFRV